MWWFKELISCFKFIAITGTQPFFKSKRVYEFVVPSTWVMLAIGLLWKYPGVFPPTFLKDLAENVFQVMVFVVPFHLAALAVFATYQAKGLDDNLAGTAAQIKTWSNADGGYFFEELTLRQYGSLLFGYLCSIGIVYVLIYLFASSMNFSAISKLPHPGIHGFLVLLEIFFVVHYFTLTIYAITFLFDKVNKIRLV
jgi:hypothetical protein